jgi:hypothetical protein
VPPVVTGHAPYGHERVVIGDHPCYIVLDRRFLPAGLASPRSGVAGMIPSDTDGHAVICASQASCLAAVVKNRLKRIQYRPELIGGFLAQTGLTLEPGPP